MPFSREMPYALFVFIAREHLGSNTKSRLLLDFRRGAQCVSPVCIGVLLGSDGQGASKADQAQHGSHAPFSAAKSNFKGPML